MQEANIFNKNVNKLHKKVNEEIDTKNLLALTYKVQIKRWRYGGERI